MGMKSERSVCVKVFGQALHVFARVWGNVAV